MNIAVSGSIAYDRIMNFPGKFEDHILPDKIHQLNVSFTIEKLKESFGGTAGNIAYSLSLLGEKPTVFGLAGTDFSPYKQWLKSKKIDISKIRVVDGFTASAYIMTDQADNQIAGFYPGPLGKNYCRIVKTIKNIKLAIISPDAKDRMMEYAKIYKRNRIAYIFDPGQQITSLDGDELRQAISGSKVLIGNDYEIQVILKKLKVDFEQLAEMTEILAVTKGAEGSEISWQGKKIIIPPAKPKKILDPTGAGDAYRAGFIKGLILNWPLEKVGRLAGLVAVYTVEQYGTQTHEFTWAGLKKRYKENYREEL